MLTNNRLLYLWCALTGGIVLVSILLGSSWIYSLIAAYDSNRWVHFFAYASVAAIPIAAWKRRITMAYSLVPPLLSIAIASSHVYFPGPVVRVENIPADIFGIAAGILLGLNIRMMRRSAKSLENSGSDRSHSTMEQLRHNQSDG